MNSERQPFSSLPIAAIFLWALLITAGFVFYAWLSTGATYAGLVADDAIYLLMAERFSLGTLQLPVHQYVNQVSHFPPLFPLLLAAAKIGSNDIGAAHWLQCALIGLASLAIGAYALSLSKHWAAATVSLALILISPATLLLSVELWSEFVFIALLYIGLCLLIKDKTSNLELILASLLLGLSAITRGFGILAIAALVLHITLKKPRRVLPAILFSLIPMALSALAGWGGNRSYYEIFRDRVTSFEKLVNVIGENAQAAWRAWIYLFDRTPDPISITFCVLVLLLAIPLLVKRLRNFDIDGLFCAAYLSLLMIWPFPAVMERLLYPVAPILIIYALISVSSSHTLLVRTRSLGEGKSRTTLPLAALAIVLIFLSVASSKSLIQRRLEPLPDAMHYLAPSRNWMSIQDRARARGRIDNAHGIITGLKRAATEIPTGDCVYSQRPQIVMLYTLRPSFPSPRDKSERSTRQCQYHLLINDGSLKLGLDAMWPDYEVLFTAKNAGMTNVILARYHN